MFNRTPNNDRIMRWVGVLIFFIFPIFSSVVSFSNNILLGLIIGLIIGLIGIIVFLVFVNQHREFLRDFLFPINLLLKICFTYYPIDHYYSDKNELKKWCKGYLRWPAFYFNNSYYFFKKSDALAFKLRWIESIKVTMEFITI